MRTQSPISDPEPSVTELPVPQQLEDPVEDDKVNFRANEKYKHVLDYIETRKEALQAELLNMSEGSSYADKGMKAETNMRIIQELENFKNEIESAYELRRQQS